MHIQDFCVLHSGTCMSRERFAIFIIKLIIIICVSLVFFSKKFFGCFNLQAKRVFLCSLLCTNEFSFSSYFWYIIHSKENITIIKLWVGSFHHINSIQKKKVRWFEIINYKYTQLLLMLFCNAYIRRTLCMKIIICLFLSLYNCIIFVRNNFF